MIYYLTALINGFFNSVNRMTNVRAGKLFGTANGALINYVEATVLSLLLMLVLKNGKELSWGYIVSVPWWVYLGSICGLLAQLLQIVGTLRSNTLVSSILMLAGNLGMSLTLDYVFYGTFSLLRAAGIFLILAGMALVEKEKTAEAQTAAEEKQRSACGTSSSAAVRLKGQPRCSCFISRPDTDIQCCARQNNRAMLCWARRWSRWCQTRPAERCR